MNAYNKAVGSFDHKLVPQIRSIEQAGVVAPERRIDAPPAIETTARPVTARLEARPRGARAGATPGRNQSPGRVKTPPTRDQSKQRKRQPARVAGSSSTKRKADRTEPQQHRQRRT